jgi:hypothetical protein
MDEALDRLAERDEGADEDGEDNRQAAETLSLCAAKEEREPERNRGERVSEVMVRSASRATLNVRV